MSAHRWVNGGVKQRGKDRVQNKARVPLKPLNHLGKALLAP